MRTAALDRQPTTERGLLALALLLSLMLHLALALGATAIPEPRREQPEWLEMALVVQEPSEPAPQPEPEPEPEPEPQIPEEPEVVEFQPEVETPPAPEPKPVARVVQGLNANSFAEGSGTGLDVRAGTTTAVRASDDTMGLDEANESTIVPYSSITKPPKIRYKPPLDIPEEVTSQEIEGRVEIVLTVLADGRVSDVTVTRSLHPAADAACVSAWRKSRWKAGLKGDQAVVTTGLPQSCKYERTLD
jgi:TonB family protein